MKLGRSEADRRAREVIKQQVELLETFGEKWWFVNVDVTASRAGVVLGRASIGGVEDGIMDWCDNQSIRQVAEEHGMIEEALEEARDLVDRLCMGRAS